MSGVPVDVVAVVGGVVAVAVAVVVGGGGGGVSSGFDVGREITAQQHGKIAGLPTKQLACCFCHC